MFLKAAAPLLAISMFAMAANAQPATPQSSSPVAQTLPSGPMPDIASMATSFLASANKPTTTEKTDVLIQRAQSAYNEKRFKDAMTALQLAQDALRRQHIDYFSTLFPQGSSNWTLEPAKPEDTVCLGEQIFGGVLALSRTYSSNGNKVKVTFITDAPVMSFIVPIMQGFAPLIAKGELAQGTIKGYPSIYVERKPGKESAKRRSNRPSEVDFPPINMPPVHALTVLMGDVIVSISSETLDKEYLTQFANILDYEKLKNGQ